MWRGAERVRGAGAEQVQSGCGVGIYRVYTEQVYRAQVPSGCAERVCRPARSSSQSQAAQGRRCPAPRAERAEARARAARGSASPRARHVASRGTRPSHRGAHRMRACGAKARGIRAARPKLLGVRRTYRSAMHRRACASGTYGTQGAAMRGWASSEAPGRTCEHSRELAQPRGRCLEGRRYAHCDLGRAGVEPSPEVKPSRQAPRRSSSTRGFQSDALACK